MSFLKAIVRLFGGEKPKQPVPVKAIPTNRTKAPTVDNRENRSTNQVSKANTSLVSALNKYRARVAIREGIKPYMVFTDRQLNLIAEAKPVNKRELSWIEGFDDQKIFQYGDEITKISKNG